MRSVLLRSVWSKGVWIRATVQRQHGALMRGIKVAVQLCTATFLTAQLRPAGPAGPAPSYNPHTTPAVPLPVMMKIKGVTCNSVRLCIAIASVTVICVYSFTRAVAVVWAVPGRYINLHLCYSCTKFTMPDPESTVLLLEHSIWACWVSQMHGCLCAFQPQARCVYLEGQRVSLSTGNGHDCTPEAAGTQTVVMFR